MERKKYLWLFALQGSIIFLSLAGLFSKKASKECFFENKFMLYYGISILIVVIYAIMWQQIIKRFEISTAYINKGTIFIWTFVWAVFFFDEHITFNNIVGCLFIIWGIVVVVRDA